MNFSLSLSTSVSSLKTLESLLHLLQQPPLSLSLSLSSPLSLTMARTRSAVSKPDPPASTKQKKRKKPAPTDSVTAAAGTSSAVRSESGRFSYGLWSEADEIRILQGLIKIKEKKGGLVATASAARELYGVMKDSLPPNVTEDSFVDKPRRMKMKFKKIHTRGFPIAAEEPFYELALKLWGDELPHNSSTTEAEAGSSRSSGASALTEFIHSDKFEQAWASLDLRNREKFEQLLLEQRKGLARVGRKLSRKKHAKLMGVAMLFFAKAYLSYTK